MKALRIHAATILVALPAVSIAADSHIAQCEKHIDPIRTVAPKLPPRLHNEFEGNAMVAYVVATDGRVQSPVVVSSKWRPIGRSGGQPIGYNEAILAAVAQWQFKPWERACRKRTPIGFSFEDKQTVVPKKSG